MHPLYTAFFSHTYASTILHEYSDRIKRVPLAPIDECCVSYIPKAQTRCILMVESAPACHFVVEFHLRPT
jgi:hypothetical protein